MKTISLKQNIKTNLAIKINEMLAQFGLQSTEKLDHIINKSLRKLSNRVSKRAKVITREIQENSNGNLNLKANGIRYNE